MMLWLAWALMAMTFGIDLAPRSAATERRFLPPNCFVGAGATKHSGQKSVEFQCTENTGVGIRRRREHISGICVRCRLNPSCRPGEARTHNPREKFDEDSQ